MNGKDGKQGPSSCLHTTNNVSPNVPSVQINLLELPPGLSRLFSRSDPSQTAAAVDRRRKITSEYSCRIMSKKFTYADVAVHSKRDDLYLIYREKVYSATKFLDDHP
jgi:cytochrome b involved in lipid metabolism